MRIDLANIDSVLETLGGEAPSSRSRKASSPREAQAAGPKGKRASKGVAPQEGEQGEEPYEVQYAKAHAKVERLLVARDRSAHELKERLLRDGFEEGVVFDLMRRCVASGLVDDMRFADVLIRSRLSAGWGIVGIERDLRKHHIEPSAVEGFPESYLGEGDSQYASARRLLDSKPPRAKNLLQAAYGKLVRKGYDSSVAHKAASDWYRAQSTDM